MTSPQSNLAELSRSVAEVRNSSHDDELHIEASTNPADMPVWNSLAELRPSAQFVEQIPIGFARQHLMLGMASGNNTLIVALGSSAGWRQLDVVSRYLKRPVSAIFAPEETVRTAINAAYALRSGQTQKLLETMSLDEVLKEVERLDSREDLLDTSGRAPVIKLVNMILFDAVTGSASDIHIQPQEERLVVRYRIDGVLFDAFEVPKHLQEETVSRVKVIGRMNIAEKRLPQDGRATVEIGDRLVDLRIASMPTSYGERIVIRLLDKSVRLYTLEELGFDPATLGAFRRLIRMEHGLILLTGPTGSGKSTTLYSALREINSRENNVLTLEDPIEYQIDGISQTQINTKKGMTFASGLRSVLRQDPDVIMLGEIRDHETAVMAIQSALTGHLVFSTLHTNDAASAVTRLLDLGIEPYLVASSLMGVQAQRLVRRICPQCGHDYQPSTEEHLRLGIAAWPSGTARRGDGCKACRGTGYRGRFVISELLVTTDEIREQIQNRANASQILEVAMKNNMRLMRDDGIQKIIAGHTTFDEVAKVTVASNA